MLHGYLPILVFIIMATLLGTVLAVLGTLLGRRSSKPNKVKLEAYECGFPAHGDARMKFDVRYYLVAILFIVFDLEIAFLFPWAIVIKKVGIHAMIAVMIFLALLTIGFVFEWCKGALEWE